VHCGGAEIVPRRACHQRRLAQADPATRLAARSVGVYNKIGDVLVAGHLPEALKRSRRARIASVWRSRPGTRAGSLILVSAMKGSATFRWRKGLALH